MDDITSVPTSRSGANTYVKTSSVRTAQKTTNYDNNNNNHIVTSLLVAPTLMTQDTTTIILGNANQVAIVDTTFQAIVWGLGGSILLVSAISCAFWCNRQKERQAQLKKVIKVDIILI